MSNSLNAFRQTCFAILVVFCCVPPNANAQHTWIGPSGDWSDTSNWNGGTAPVSGTANLSITFDSSTPNITATQNLAYPFDLQEIVFDSIGANIDGGPIRFMNLGAGPRISSTNGSGFSIHSDLIFDETVSFEFSQNAIGRVNGNISGTGGIEKNGVGQLHLTGNNSFTGGIVINRGMIKGSTASFNNNDVVFNNPGGIIGIGVLLEQSFDGTFNGQISGRGFLEKRGTGTLTLGANNSYTEYTSIQGGTLRLAANNAISPSSTQLFIGQNATLDLNGFDATINDTWLDGNLLLGTGNLTHNLNKNNTVIEGVISGDGSYNIQNAIFPTWQLVMNGQSSHTGGTHVDGATLILGASERFADTGDITMSNGSTLDVGTYSETVRNLFLLNSSRAIGTGEISATNLFQIQTDSDIAIDASLTGTGDLIKSGTGFAVMNGAVTHSGNTIVQEGELVLNTGDYSGDFAVESDGELTFSGAGTGIVSGTISGTGDVQISGGTTTFAGTNTYSGTTLITGTLVAGRNDALAADSILSFGNDGTLDINNQSIRVSQVFGEGNIDLGDEGSFTVDTIHSNNRFDGIISGSGGLHVTGGGQLSIGGLNTFTGSAIVNDAKLRTNNGGALLNVEFISVENNGHFQISGSLLTNAEFVLTDGSLTGGSLTAASYQFQSGFVSTRLQGPASLSKSGEGEVWLTNSQNYNGGTNVLEGKLIGDRNSLNGNIFVSSVGSLEINQTSDSLFGNAFNATLVGSGTVIKSGQSDLILYQPNTSFSGTFQHMEGKLIVTENDVFGTGKLILQKDVAIESTGGPRSFTNETQITGGMLFTGTEGMDFTNVSLVNAKAGETLRNDNTGGTILNGRFQGDAGSVLSAEAGSFSLGDANSFVGFRTSGEIHVASGASLTANSAGFVDAGPVVNLSGGTLNAPNGIAIGGAENIFGHGTINAKVAAQSGSIIAATSGNLTLGDGSAFDGFFSDGILIANNNTVVINDLNSAVLGSLTRLGDGTGVGRLEAGTAQTSETRDHFFLEEGKNLTGRGTIAGNFKNNGLVAGDGIAADELLIFESPWIVSGKGIFENVQIDGTFAPGESPGIVDTTNITLGGNVEIEIGGLTAGFGIGHHDLIRDSAMITLNGSATLEILAYDGFQPAIGDEFVVMTWENALVGEFGSVNVDPFFHQNGIQFEVHYNNKNGPGNITLAAFSSVPEPASVILFGVIGIAWMLRRQRCALPI